MKKIYSKPELKVIFVETQKMIADSLPMGGSKGNYSESSGQLSREASSWDDEE